MALMVQHTRPLNVDCWFVYLCGVRAPLQTTQGFTSARTGRRRPRLRPGTAPPPDGPGGRVGLTLQTSGSVSLIQLLSNP